MSRFSLDYLLDSMLTLDDTAFATRHLCTKNEARQFIEGGIVPASWRSTRAMLFRMAGAVAIAEQMKAEDTDDCAVEGWRDTTTRPADDMAPMHYEPNECEVCRRPSMQGSVYCSDSCRKIMDGEPSMKEQALEM